MCSRIMKKCRVFKVISNFEREVMRYTTNIQEIDIMEDLIRQTSRVQLTIRINTVFIYEKS